MSGFLISESPPCMYIYTGVFLQGFMFWQHLTIFSPFRSVPIHNKPTIQTPKTAFHAYICMIYHQACVKTAGLRMNCWHFFSQEQMLIDFSNPKSKCNVCWLFILLKSITSYQCHWWDTYSFFLPKYLLALPAPLAWTWSIHVSSMSCVFFKQIQVFRHCKGFYRGPALQYCLGGGRKLTEV